MAQQSLAEFLGVQDPRPADSVSQTDFEQLVDVSDPKEFCKRILKTREFRQYIMNGIVLGDIPQAIMGRIMDHALGKPAERFEVHTHAQNPFDAMEVEQVEQRIVFLETLLQRLREREDSEAQGSLIH